MYPHLYTASTQPTSQLCSPSPSNRRRLDRLEHCVGSIVSKVDSILLKLEDLELMDTAVERDPRAASASAAAAGGDAVPEAVENAVRRELQRRITESTKRSTTGVSESKI